MRDWIDALAGAIAIVCMLFGLICISIMDRYPDDGMEILGASVACFTVFFLWLRYYPMRWKK